MLNPYHGTVQTLETERADAVTRDGVTWSLYIHHEEEFVVHPDGRRQRVDIPDIKYATWSEHQGLQRAPVRLTMDYDSVERLGTALLDAIKAHMDQLPFPQRDCYELWLLDAEQGEPLALLDSSDTPDKEVRSLQWRPGQAAQKYFADGEDNLALHVAELVARVAGKEPRALWFRRDAEGNGHSVDMHLPANAFPPLLLREDWPDPEHSRMIAEFLHWQSPWLLQLQHLPPGLRRTVEQQACCHARRLAEYYRLYPEILQQERLTAALVEARLRETTTVATCAENGEDDNVLIPFYRE
jgi:hypothetical protein